MDLLEAHNFIRYILQKERGGWVAPEEIDDVLYRGGWIFYNKEFEGYAINQVLKDSLSTFSTKFSFITLADAQIQLPIDPLTKPCYEHLLSIFVQYYDNKNKSIRYKSIKLLSEDEIAERLDSQILKPIPSDPTGEQLGVGLFQLYPKVICAGNGYYLRQPARPIFSYTMGGSDGRTIVYNQSASKQMEWNASSMNKVLILAAGLAGVNIGDKDFVQYSEAKNQQDI